MRTEAAMPARKRLAHKHFEAGRGEVNRGRLRGQPNGCSLGVVGRAYFLGRVPASELLQRLQRLRCGLTLPWHLGQRRVFSFCTKELWGRVRMEGVLF